MADMTLNRGVRRALVERIAPALVIRAGQLNIPEAETASWITEALHRVTVTSGWLAEDVVHLPPDPNRLMYRADLDGVFISAVRADEMPEVDAPTAAAEILWQIGYSVPNDLSELDEVI